MLPREVITRFSLVAGAEVPAVSTYFLFDADSAESIESEARFEAVRVAGNFVYADLEARLEGGFLPGLEMLGDRPERIRARLDEEDAGDFPWARTSPLPPGVDEAFDQLVPLARRLLKDRVAAGAQVMNRIDHRIKVSGPETIEIRERPRNGIAEGVVTELMILTNRITADRLAAADLPAVYRTQRVTNNARTRADLTVIPREHDGLGSSLYCWSTSPLRRYADLINQRQLGSLIGGPLPVFTDVSELLVRAKRTEFQGKAANEHQRRIERYWTLKYLEAHTDEIHPVTLERRQDRLLVRFENLPLVMPVDPAMTKDLPAGALRFLPERFDYHALTVEGRFASMP